MHVTGDLENLGQGTPEDKRYFVTVADERTILHFGSSYGGNALLGKIAHGLRQAAYDGWASGEFLAEQFMLLGITDKVTGKKWHIAGGFPSASGKTNLAMTLSPDALGDRYYVEFYGDDIAWMWVGEDGRLYGMNPEFGVFGVAKDTNEKTNPTAIESIAPGTRAIFTNVAYNAKTQEVWFEGRTPEPPADLDGWLDWKGNPIADRSPAEADDPWAHPNSRFTTTLANVPNVADDYENPAGVPIDGIIFGGRTRDREPLIRAITDVAEGVYDGLTLGAEATFAADGLDGQLRYDPMSMRPFMSYPEGPYAAHWLNIIGAVHRQADLRARQLVPAGRRGRPLPVARLPRQPARAAVADAAARRRGDRGRVAGRASCRPRTSSTSTASTSTRPTSTRCSPSTSTGGSRRSASARRTSSSSRTSPRRSGRRTAASPRPSANKRQAAAGRCASRSRRTAAQALKP